MLKVPSFLTSKLPILLPALAFFFATCASNKVVLPDLKTIQLSEKPKNIILLIGDGMALSQVSAGMYWSGGLEKSVFSLFPYVGFHKSHAHDDIVTDSAAGATAFACGQKTFNGAIGMKSNKKACETILEEWVEDGKSAGIVVTCSATHATPASFLAHVDSRAYTERIAFGFLDTPVDCYVGGGSALFDDRYDNINLLDSLKRRDYVIRRGTNLNRMPLDGSKPFMLFTHEKEPETASAGRKYLPEAVEKVAGFLKNRSKKGFFMLVEGSQIDWACHANDRNWLKAEMLDFDQAIRKALAYAAADTETLVLVTGDHECGGFSLKEADSRKAFKLVFGSHYHTATMVPVFAFGPGAAQFQGIYDNTEIYFKMKALMRAE